MERAHLNQDCIFTLGEIIDPGASIEVVFIGHDTTMKKPVAILQTVKKITHIGDNLWIILLILSFHNKPRFDCRDFLIDSTRRKRTSGRTFNPHKYSSPQKANL